MYSTFLGVKKERLEGAGLTIWLLQPDFSVLMSIWGKEGAYVMAEGMKYRSLGRTQGIPSTMAILS